MFILINRDMDSIDGAEDNIVNQINRYVKLI